MSGKLPSRGVAMAGSLWMGVASLGGVDITLGRKRHAQGCQGRSTRIGCIYIAGMAGCWRSPAVGSTVHRARYPCGTSFYSSSSSPHRHRLAHLLSIHISSF